MSFESLPEEDKQRLAAQVDYFVTAVLRRYGLNEDDVPNIVEAVHYMRERHEFLAKLKAGSALSLIGLAVAAAGSAIWNGIKVLLMGAK